AGDAGAYSVSVANAAGAVQSAGAVITLNQPPLITRQPLGHTNLVGTANLFCVTATGTAPLAYQWLLNGAPIPGATASTCLVSNIVAGNAGNYSVQVSNIAGVTASTNVVLTAVPDTIHPTLSLS